MKRVAFHTLGCKLNYAETASIGRQFLELGYKVVALDEEADVCVINTCSVTERADRECRQLIRRALRGSPEAYVIVVGCYAQLEPEEVASILGVSLVLGAKEKFELFRYVDGFKKKSYPTVVTSDIGTVNDFGPAFSGGFGDRTRAFLKVQDGCDYACSFCTIPVARGASRSQSIADTVVQARELVALGYKEIVLTGVNVGDYGRKLGANLAAMLETLVPIEGLERIRISSIEPNLLTDELITLMVSSNKVCNHFHLPLQSGSDEVLKRMRRRYRAAQYRNVIETIKARCPEAAVGADVIVGFPGETEAHFEETYRFLLDLPVTYLHVFTYSERPNTSAASRDGAVEPRVRFQRNKMLRILSKKKKRRFYEEMVGHTVHVLFESDVEQGRTVGWTENYVKVGVEPQPALVNELLPVRIRAVKGEICLGELASKTHDSLPVVPPLNIEIPVRSVEAM